jgi:hypothetical protein
MDNICAVPMHINQDAGNCTYNLCTHAGHEVCQVMRDWIRELCEAIDAGDLARAQELRGRLK